MRRRGAALLAALALAAGGAGAEKTVALTFTGDVTLGTEEIYRRYETCFDAYAEREGYGWFFRNMRELFASDDLTLVNLEGVLSDSQAEEDTRKTFRFRGKTDYVRILTESSIEACAVSNNHIRDYGKQGYAATLKTLEENGVKYCGNDHSFILEKDGIRIGFFALGSQYYATYGRTVRDTIAQMRADGVNAIVCSFHAGGEYNPRHRERDQEQYARTAIEEWGADLVIMHHPHVLQGIDVINHRYVFYSLGNFCFGGNMNISAKSGNASVRALETAAVRMELIFSDEGEYLGQRGRIYPCYASSSAEKAGDPNDFQPKPVTGEEARGVLERIQADTAFELGEMEEEGYVTLPLQSVSEEGGAP